jgi:hypothetical protein
MAIQLVYTDSMDNEHPAAYARIEEINTHFQRKTSHMVVAIYKSLLAMQRNKQPVGQVVIDLQETAQDDGMPAHETVFGQPLYNAKKTDPRALGYAFLKIISPFKDGLDV